MHDVVVVSLGTPVLVGVYCDGAIIEEIRKEGMSSDVLAEIFESLLERYPIDRLLYAKGPGSFMGIKVAYLFLKTLSITKKIPLLATDAFFFNENGPIKAVGKLYFVKNSTAIILEPLESPDVRPFALPQRIDHHYFDTDNLPDYGIGAV